MSGAAGQTALTGATPQTRPAMEPKSSADKYWEITIENVAEPEVMKAKLEASPFFRKCGGSKTVRVVDSNVLFTFVSKLSKQDVQKKCATTFKAYSSCQTHRVAEVGAGHAQSTTEGTRWDR